MNLLELFEQYISIHQSQYELADDFSPCIAVYPNNAVVINGGDMFSWEGTKEQAIVELNKAIANNQLIENNAG
jgi:hypothetical protein